MKASFGQEGDEADGAICCSVIPTAYLTFVPVYNSINFVYQDEFANISQIVFLILPVKECLNQSIDWHLYIGPHVWLN